MYEKPNKVEGGVPDRFRSGSKTDIVPTEYPGEWIQIDYTDISFGVKVWDTVTSDMAEVERKLKNNKILTIGAIEAEELYCKAVLRKMEVSLNGERLPKTWYDLEGNQAGFRFLKKWVQHKIDDKPFPKPAWLQEDEQQDPISASDPGPDPAGSCGSTGDEAGTECIDDC